MHNRPTPTFSIITVTYNAEAVLEDTIQSVISQTYHHVEYIIIDGASKDRTLAIAERYRDRITLLEALSMAGDLTIYGRRDRVAVIRENDGQRTILYHDLRSSDVFNSPCYYLQQNDIVYVEPNNSKAGQSEINQNKLVGVWLSAGSILVSIVSLIVTLTK